MSMSNPNIEAAKSAGDALSVGVVLGTLAEILPAIAALLAIIWTCLRIYESATVQRMLGKNPHARHDD